ncbi:MAG TPA: hypothetical protein VFK06_23765, partial [Candidatus Angelobacter sp.]|nr:hypothetical protein [Candidatus Angelobacter sp.]
IGTMASANAFLSKNRLAADRPTFWSLPLSIVLYQDRQFTPGGFFFHSTNRITLRRFIRSSA